MKKHILKLKENMSKFKYSKELKIPLLTLAIGLLLGYLITSSGYIPNTTDVNTSKAKVLVETYLNTLNLEDFKVNSVVAENELFKISLNVAGRDYTSYMTKDGKFLFPESIDLTAKPATDATNAGANGSQPVTDLPKSDKPVVELFVMSHCPYGTQIEKGILPVIDTLGDKMDLSIKFVNYAMHGEKEVKEQLNQYCIQKEMGKQTYTSYLKCFLDAGDSEACLTSNNINRNALTTCTTKADSEFKIMANFNDQSTWNGTYPPFNTDLEANKKYGVQGSPTLVINGVEAQSGRDAASLLKSICSAFNNAPAECTAQLDAASPTPGFGFGKTTTDASAAQCN